MPKQDPLRPSPEKVKEGLRGVFEAVKREEAGDREALGKFIDEQAKKLKAQRAARGLSTEACEKDVETKPNDMFGAFGRGEESFDQMLNRVIARHAALSKQVREKYGGVVEQMASELLHEDWEIPEDEFWTRVNGYWDSLDEEAQRRSRETVFERRRALRLSGA